MLQQKYSGSLNSARDWGGVLPPPAVKNPSRTTVGSPHTQLPSSELTSEQPRLGLRSQVKNTHKCGPAQFQPGLFKGQLCFLL